MPSIKQQQATVDTEATPISTAPKQTESLTRSRGGQVESTQSSVLLCQGPWGEGFPTCEEKMKVRMDFIVVCACKHD